MILDFVRKTDYFTLTTGPTDNLSQKDLMTEYGMDIGKNGIAYCRSPYTAAPFHKHATPEATAELVQIIRAYEDSSKIESRAHIKCPADQELRGFQKADIEYLLARGGGLDADEPGLGKTPTAICFANEIGAKRVLVICPAAVRRQWETRIREWSTMPYPINIYLVMGSRSGVREEVEWTIVSYDLARTEGIGKALASGTYDLIILDEAHMLKTSESSRTRAIFGDYATGTYRRKDNHEFLFDSLRSRAGAILALTGTPLLNRPREAYTLARAMCLGAETPTITSNGIKPLAEVQAEDLVWDGLEWVSHAGVAYQGRKRARRWANVWATGDHEIRSGGTWTMWSNVLDEESTRYRALVTGLESLQSLATAGGHAASVWRSNAPVVGPLIEQPRLICEVENRLGVKIAGMLGCLRQTLGDMAPGLPIPEAGASCSAEYPPSPDAAKIRETVDTNGMGHAASLSGPDGLQIGARSLTILPGFPVAGVRVMNLIAETTTGTMNPEISAGCQEPLTPKINDLLSCSLPASESWKHVYDIVNAGPRRRFTILTDAGPLVVHNCWDSIDWLSEQAFQNRFNPVVRKNGTRKDGTFYTFTEEQVGRFAELQFRLRGHFMTRHLKRAVLPQLKLPVYDIVNVVETGAVKEALYAESLLGIDPDNFDGKDIQILGHIAQVRHMMGLAIAPQVADFVDMLIDGGETKLVVFAWHKDVLDFYQTRFDRYGVVRIDGSTSHDDREIRKTMFIHGNAQIIIGNMQAMGVGTDGLQMVANHALLAEPDWVPSNNVQAIDRLDRYGQARTVTADIFVAPNSVLEKILASALKKAHNIHKSLDRSI